MRFHRWQASWILVAFGMAAPAPAATFTVQVAQGGSLTFSPAVQPISAGDTVHWVWGSSGHSTTSGNACSPDGLWDSGVQGTPFTFDVTFTMPGTYPYHCSVHCFLGMTGTIVVSEPPPTPTPAPGSAVPALSPPLLAVLGVILAIAALFLLRKS